MKVEINCCGHKNKQQRQENIWLKIAVGCFTIDFFCDENRQQAHWKTFDLEEVLLTCVVDSPSLPRVVFIYFYLQVC